MYTIKVQVLVIVQNKYIKTSVGFWKACVACYSDADEVQKRVMCIKFHIYVLLRKYC